MTEKYYLYILKSKSSGKYYVGSTQNLDKRIKLHNDENYTGTKTTKRFKYSRELVYQQTYSSLLDTMNSKVIS